MKKRRRKRVESRTKARHLADKLLRDSVRAGRLEGEREGTARPAPKFLRRDREARHVDSEERILLHAVNVLVRDVLEYTHGQCGEECLDILAPLNYSAKSGGAYNQNDAISSQQGESEPPSSRPLEGGSGDGDPESGTWEGDEPSGPSLWLEEETYPQGCLIDVVRSED